MLLFVGSGRALGTIWWIKPDVDLTVGRKDAPLLVEGDGSVSRKHASLLLDSEDPTRVNVLDNGSKFGVHINGRRCSADSKSVVHVGDRVTFGGQGSVFELRECAVALCIANIHSGMESLVSSIHADAEALGIDVVDEADKCTHLIVPQLEITRKLVHGLAANCWIVSPDFLQQLKSHPPTHTVADPTVVRVNESIRSMQHLPIPQTPKMASDSPINLRDVNWLPDRRRQRLFDAALFAFADATQYEKYCPIVEASGGKCTQLVDVQEWAQSTDRTAAKMDDQCKALSDKLRELAKDTGSNAHLLALRLVIPPARQVSDTLADLDIAAFVKRVAGHLGVRPIAESEISLAILFVSCDEHTNPAPKGADSLVTAQPENAGIAAAPRTHRRRKAARVSSFWESAVANNASESSASIQPPGSELNGLDGQNEDTVADADSLSNAPTNDHDLTANLRASVRHRRNVGDFWNSAITSAPSDATSVLVAEPEPINPADEVTSMPVPPNPSEMPTDNDAPQTGISTTDGMHTRQTDTSGNAIEQSGARLRTVVLSLIKSKMHSAVPTSASADRPNFKRFKKTVHPYQLM